MDKNTARKLYQSISGEYVNAIEAAGIIAEFMIFGEFDASIVNAFDADLAEMAGKPIMVLDGDEWKAATDRDGAARFYPTVAEWYAKPTVYSYVVKAARKALVSYARKMA